MDTVGSAGLEQSMAGGSTSATWVTVGLGSGSAGIGSDVATAVTVAVAVDSGIAMAVGVTSCAWRVEQPAKRPMVNTKIGKAIWLESLVWFFKIHL